MKKVKDDFIKQCIKNREYLGLTYKDMSLCLIGVSEENYIDFEDGKFLMSKENICRLIKVLCIKKTNDIDYSNYLDTTGLNEEEVKDLSMVLEAILGDEYA